MLSAVWFLVVVFATHVIFTYAVMKPFESKWNLCVLLGKFNNEFDFETWLNVYISVSILLGISIMIGTNVYVLYLTIQSEKQFQGQLRSHGRTTSRSVLFGLLIEIVPSIISSIPLLILMIINFLTVDFPDVALEWILILCIPMNATVNPFIYSFLACQRRLKQMKNKK